MHIYMHASYIVRHALPSQHRMRVLVRQQITDSTGKYQERIERLVVSRRGENRTGEERRSE